MGYLDGLRQLVLNEIEVGGKKPEDDNGPDESDNFMDDTNNGDDQPATTDDTTPPPTDDTTEDGESDNFMDDSGDDGDTSTDEGEPPAEGDTSGEDGSDESDNFMDDSGDEGSSEGDDTSGEDTGGDDGGEEGDSDNFMDDSGDGEGSDDGGGEEGESSGDEGDNTEEDDGDDFGINKIEDELFSTLTPEQKAIKNEELKNQFIDLYSVIGTTLDRINNVSKSNENVEALGFVTQKLLELREMIDYIITKSYATKTYIENNIIYQQCISTLNLISEFINNIPNVNGDTDDEDTSAYKGEPVDPEEDNSTIKEPTSLDISDTSVSDYRAENEGTDYNSLF